VLFLKPPGSCSRHVTSKPLPLPIKLRRDPVFTASDCACSKCASRPLRLVTLRS